MTMEGRGAKVSMFSRVLAWIFLGCAVLAMVGIAVQMFLGRAVPLQATEAVMFFLGLLIVCPLFLFVALTGRSPHWMSSMDNLFGDEAPRPGTAESATRGKQSLVPLAISLVFGLALFLFGMQLELFSAETGWFAMAVFGVVWLIVVAMLWRNFRRRNLRP